MGKEVFDQEVFRKDLKLEAKALGVPSGAADVFIEKTLEETAKKISKKKIITKKDLERIIASELKKYNADLAYVYQIRDKII